MDIYQRLKVKTYINAWDAVSAYGSSRMEPETLAAMRDAASKYVPIRDLQQAVGRKIAQMTGNEAAYVVSGTAAGMLMASAVCMVRHPEPELFAMLPNAQELLDDIEAGVNTYDFVEVMACPGGCVGGGGQPFSDDRDKSKERGDKLYALDEKREKHCSHENPEIIKLYEEYFGSPLGEKAQRLLHVKY